MSPTTTALDLERHHREADRLVHELVGGLTYWATDSEDGCARRITAIETLIRQYRVDIAAHNAKLDNLPAGEDLRTAELTARCDYCGETIRRPDNGVWTHANGLITCGGAAATVATKRLAG